MINAGVVIVVVVVVDVGLRCGGVFCIAKFVTDSLVVVVEVCGGMVVLVVDAIRGGVFSKMN